MHDKHLANQVGQLCQALSSEKLTLTVLILDRAVGDDRFKAKFDKWSKQARERAMNPATEELSSGIHFPPNTLPQMLPSNVQDMNGLPLLNLGKFTGAKQGEELQRLIVHGVLQCMGDRVVTFDLGRLPNATCMTIEGFEGCPPGVEGHACHTSKTQA